MSESDFAKAALTLRNSISSLERQSISHEFWLYLWATLVAIGVIAELAFVLSEFHEDNAAFRRGIIRPPDRPSRIKLILELLAVSLVAVGVTGELFIDVEEGTNQTDLRNKNRELSDLLSDQSAAFQKEAATRLEQAKKNLDEAEFRLSPWKLDASAMDRIADKIKPFRGTPFAYSVDSHPYAIELADKMEQVFFASNWELKSYSGHPYDRPVAATGITIELIEAAQLEKLAPAERNLEPAAKALADALSAEGIPAKLIPVAPRSKPAKVHLIIGRK